MGSNQPWWKFYYKDYLLDTDILSPQGRGGWITALCTMRNEEVAQLSGDLDYWTSLFNTKTPKKTQEIIEELKSKKICTVTRNAIVTQDNEIITLISRRRKRELKDKQNNKLRQTRYRAKQKHNASVTAQSQSHINKSHINKKKTTPLPPKGGGFSLPEFINPETWKDFLGMRKSLKKPTTLKAQELLIKKLIQFYGQGQNPNTILEQSIINSWQGVFPLKIQTENPINIEQSDFTRECEENRKLMLADMKRHGYKPEDQ